MHWYFFALYMYTKVQTLVNIHVQWMDEIHNYIME